MTKDIKLSTLRQVYPGLSRYAPNLMMCLYKSEAEGDLTAGEEASM